MSKIKLVQPTATGNQWQPLTEGHEISTLPELIKIPDGQKVREKAASILGSGQEPISGSTGSRTGLVVGYVQSGKTLSFTSVIALARDNNIPLVIVIAGTKNPLYEQTKDRLLGDLQVEKADGPPRWLHFPNPSIDSQEAIQRALNEWLDPSIPKQEVPTLLLVVAKNWSRLSTLNELLCNLDLAQVPALVIDDEADQASLNTKINQDKESTTYTQLVGLRDCLPNHTLLQYTATPQAPLLVNIIDVLSPQFVSVLDPGKGYVGGKDFFDGSRKYIVQIPPNEIVPHGGLLSDTPPSLLSALRIFFVGVTAGRIEGWSEKNPRRSMLVHPSRTTDRHFEYIECIRAAVAHWQSILRLPETDSDKADLKSQFLDAYQNLGKTVDNLPKFEDIWASLSRYIASTRIEEINTRRGGGTPRINWMQSYSWILVGGQAMDRGFTVQGLTVTYMPRDPGGGNADTVQQRARFFGYKRNYLGYCRVYLESDVLDAFENYVKHEEEMRKELQGISSTNADLRQWKRRFVLSSALNPCRRNVIQHNYVRGNYSNEWAFPKMLLMNNTLVDDNKKTVSDFVNSLSFKKDTSYVSDQPAQQHLVCEDVPLEKVINDLLVPYRVEDGTDTEHLLGAMLQLSTALSKNGQETVRVYNMRPKYKASRGVDKEGSISTVRRLFQGPTRAGSGSGYTYPGDHEFRDSGNVTIQLHTFDLTRDGVTLLEDVPTFVVWIPKRMSLDWVTQAQS